ncbi:MAG: hypothetical protein CVU38_19735 [Chloroflexi bacterium HGW-Chloroflexi-1]|nr:MAG: hypothetical protein CVU38_19735 [Chloroflexi bacterium HGW-Chloroflexi-1]
MVVTAFARSDSTREGVVPFNAARHLRQVTELVSAIFADELDASGRSMLREMRLVGQLSPFLGGLLSVAFFDNFVAGYVWVEAGRVIGNATLQRADFTGIRWRISNVAVAPGRRGLGIAYHLMEATVREIAKRGGNWAVLQVQADNPAARHLYESLGFTDVCQDGVWKLPVLPANPPRPDPNVALRPLRASAWRDRLDLAHAACTSLAHWADAVNPADYQMSLWQYLGEMLGNLTGFYRVARWGVLGEADWLGAVETHATGIADSHTLRFAVRPEARGKLEDTLVAQGLRTLAGAPDRPVLVEHSADHAEGVAALEAAGFRPQRVLLTMRRLIVPGDAGKT